MYATVRTGRCLYSAERSYVGEDGTTDVMARLLAQAQDEGA
ncbi:hypothetical protein [Streptomyces spinoverrucosus]|nr:hypothetical protein [Streptomyces spinoverrucosus]